MSLTPIYDELRELRIIDSATGTSEGKRRASPRTVSPLPSNGRIGQLVGRQGLGGRHRRPAD